MARKSARKSAARPVSTAPASTSPPDATDRERAIEAFMELLAEQSFEEIGFAEVAARADVSLPELRNAFGSTIEILAAHMKDVDRAVLAADNADMAEEPARERLFDVLMRRLEVLTPHKEAIRSLSRSTRSDPWLALALNALAVRSQQWMLTAADIGASGPKGMVRAQGLALLFAGVLRTWINDDDEGHARTMAALDRALARGQRWAGVLDNLCRIPACASRLRPRRRRPATRTTTSSSRSNRAAISRLLNPPLAGRSPAREAWQGRVGLLRSMNHEGPTPNPSPQGGGTHRVGSETTSGAHPAGVKRYTGTRTVARKPPSGLNPTA